MWKIDETGRFQFSDNTDPNQTTLFTIEPDYNLLKRLILSEFKGKKIKMKELEEFVLVKTPFRKSGHLRKPILSKMEKADPPEIRVIRRQMRYRYPDTCEIEFL